MLFSLGEIIFKSWHLSVWPFYPFLKIVKIAAFATVMYTGALISVMVFHPCQFCFLGICPPLPVTSYRWLPAYGTWGHFSCSLQHPPLPSAKCSLRLGPRLYSHQCPAKWAKPILQVPAWSWNFISKFYALLSGLEESAIGQLLTTEAVEHSCVKVPGNVTLLTVALRA